VRATGYDIFRLLAASDWVNLDASKAECEKRQRLGPDVSARGKRAPTVPCSETRERELRQKFYWVSSAEDVLRDSCHSASSTRFQSPSLS
jgi:hypothetical protein